MFSNSLLDEFVSKNPGELQRRLTLAFSDHLDASDDEAVEGLREVLDAIMEERTDALNKDQACVLPGFWQL
jgi:hypothetical protein